MVPFLFAYVPLYFGPVYLTYLYKIREKKIKWTWLSVFIISGYLYCLYYLLNYFNFTRSGGKSIMGIVLWKLYPAKANLIFLIISFAGFVTVAYFIFKFPKRNYIWAVALPIFLVSQVFWQRYFDPMIVILIFITLPPHLMDKLVKTRLILLYPLLEIILYVDIIALIS
jgi:hypothetical protein